VIKIENPVSGDDTRGWGPPFANPLPEFATSTYRGESAYFLAVIFLSFVVSSWNPDDFQVDDDKSMTVHDKSTVD
jgi:hypothetical protein